MYKENLALNNQLWLICHESKAKQSKSYIYIYIYIYIYKGFGIKQPTMIDMP